MTDQQLYKAIRLKAERDDIQALIDFLTDDNHRPCFDTEVKKNGLTVLYVPECICEKI